jgi:hypothetical protein
MPSSAALASSRIGVPLRARCGLKRGLERLDLVGLMIQKGREDLLERPLPVAEAEALRGWNRVELIVAERRVGAAITIPLGGMGINSMAREALHRRGSAKTALAGQKISTAVRKRPPERVPFAK